MQWMHSFRVHATVVGHARGSTPLAVWKTLWKLRVPRKVHIFGWRILRGIILLGAILIERHIGSNGACPICNQGSEDIRHLLFQCTSATELWRRLGVTHIIDQALQVDRSGSVILEFILSLQDQQLAVHLELNFKQVIIVGGWYLWWIWRRVTHNEAIPSAWKWPLSVLSISSNHQRASAMTQGT